MSGNNTKRPLEKRGLVKLDVSEQDRRSCIVALTPVGKATVAKAGPCWAAAQRRFESAFGKDAAVELRTVLKEIATAEFRLGHCDEHPGFDQEHSAARHSA